MLIPLFSGVLKAQTAKKDSAKQHEEHFYRIPERDYRILTSLAADYKQAVMYDPQMGPAQKVALFQFIEKYLVDIPKRVKADSVKVIVPKK